MAIKIKGKDGSIKMTIKDDGTLEIHDKKLAEEFKKKQEQESTKDSRQEGSDRDE